MTLIEIKYVKKRVKKNEDTENWGSLGNGE